MKQITTIVNIHVEEAKKETENLLKQFSKGETEIDSSKYKNSRIKLTTFNYLLLYSVITRDLNLLYRDIC